MSWRDFFYFSKGERSGLIVLLCLISIAGILLIWNNKPESVQDTGTKQVSVENSIASDTGKLAGRPLSSGSVSKQPSFSKRNLSTESELLSAKSSSSARSLSSEQMEEVSDKNVSRSKTSFSGKKNPAENKKESVSGRIKRLTSYSRPSYSRVEKFQEGTVVELNSVDTIILKKIPGIGSVFARRIVNYRNLLGGYYSVIQLSEVYGIDEDKYNALLPWFEVDPSLISRLKVNSLPQDSLRRLYHLRHEVLLPSCPHSTLEGEKRETLHH